MPIEPLSTILDWVVGISAIIFIPIILICFTIIIIKFCKDL